MSLISIVLWTWKKTLWLISVLAVSHHFFLVIFPPPQIILSSHPPLQSAAPYPVIHFPPSSSPPYTRQPSLPHAPSPLLAVSILARPSLFCHPEEVTVMMMHGAVIEETLGIIISIIVIISQMRRAKLELCPSPSGCLTVTNSSLIHFTHQLYTGQRSTERQGVVVRGGWGCKGPSLRAAPNCGANAPHSAPPSALMVSVFFQSLWEQETSCHHASNNHRGL